MEAGRSRDVNKDRIKIEYGLIFTYVEYKYI